MGSHNNSIDDLITLSKKDCFKDDVKFSYDSLSWKVTIGLQNNVEIALENIGNILGFQAASQFISMASTGEADLERLSRPLPLL